MTQLIGHLLAFGLVLLQGAIGIGLLISLGELALGRRGALRHLLGVAVAFTICWLWEAGQLAPLMARLVNELLTGHSVPPPFVGPA
jgi:hypothetical protein